MQMIRTIAGLAILAVLGTGLFPNNGHSTTTDRISDSYDQSFSAAAPVREYVTLDDMKQAMSEMEVRLTAQMRHCQCVDDTARSQQASVSAGKAPSEDLKAMAKQALSEPPVVTDTSNVPPSVNPVPQSICVNGQCITDPAVIAAVSAAYPGLSTSLANPQQVVSIKEEITAINGVKLSNPIPVSPAGTTVQYADALPVATYTSPAFNTGYRAYQYSGGACASLSSNGRYAVANGARYVREFRGPRRSRTIIYY